MSGFIDLHSHWLPGIDDGARSADEGLALLKALRGAGFSHVVATPHMRPGMFDNDRAQIEATFTAMLPSLGGRDDLPIVSLSSEHYLDDVTFTRLVHGEGVAYQGGRAALIEVHTEIFPARLADRFFDLRIKGLLPVLAHPERYTPVANDDKLLDPIVDGGAVLLLDVCSLVGKYGRRAEKTARRLLEGGYYYAACSDAHRPQDVEDVRRAIDELARFMGNDEAQFMLREGPQNILLGRVES